MYKLKHNKEGFHTLVTPEDTPVHCPFKMPFATPGKIQGQMNLNFHLCRSDCALFHIYKNNDGKTNVFLYCGNGRTFNELNLSVQEETSSIRPLR